MAKPRMGLSAFVGKLLEDQDGDVLREGIRVLSQALHDRDAAVAQRLALGPGPQERHPCIHDRPDGHELRAHRRFVITHGLRSRSLVDRRVDPFSFRPPIDATEDV